MLKQHGPVIERGAMEDLCVNDGMNRFSFHAFVSWSPVIAKYGPQHLRPAGQRVSQRQVEDLLAKRPASRASHRVLHEHSRTDDGRVWLSYRLSKAASTYTVIAIPAALRNVVGGRFTFVVPEATRSARWPRRTAGLGASARSSASTTPRSAITSC